MIGEYTDTLDMFLNVAKYNGVEKCGIELENTIMDIINHYEQCDDESEKKIKVKEIMELIESRSDFHKELIQRFGHFYFNFYKRFKDVDRKFIFRFLYLCSFMNYDNYLSNGKRLLHGDDLKDLLNLGNTEFYRTKMCLVENGLIIINDKDLIKINEKYCKKGVINKTKSIEVIRMFNDAIKELYNKSLPKEHKKLALLIDLLPYVNYRHNLLCKNPKEQRIELIEPLKMSEICSILGYDKTNVSKIKRQLLSLKVNSEEVIGIFEKSCGKSIYVNPRVYYKGNDIEELESLVNMFKVKC